MSAVSGVGYQSYYSNRTEYGRFASGKRINSAADDAAGLAIAQKIASEQGGLNAAAKNIGSGIAAANVADGAMSGITDYMQKINELSIQAMNGLYSDSDRQAIQNQIDSYMEGIGQIASSAKYNETYLLNGSASSVNIVSGADGSGTQLPLADGTLSALGLKGYSVKNGTADLDSLNAAFSYVSQSRSRLGAATNGLEHAYAYNRNAYEQHTASRSRIEDLDVGKAVSDQKKNQLLQNYRMMMQKRQIEQDGMRVRLIQM